jgi:hypothetical protein
MADEAYFLPFLPFAFPSLAAASSFTFFFPATALGSFPRFFAGYTFLPTISSSSSLAA